MREREETRTDRRWLLGALLAYVVAAAVLLPHYRCCIDNDGTAYISEARKFAAGEFLAAVNGHWSPLLPLTLAPLFRLGVPETWALKLHILATGLLTLFGAYRLMFRFRLTPPVRRGALAVLTPMILYYALIRPTPDLLAMGLFLGYYLRVSREDYGARPTDGLWCGLWATAAYLAKAYMLPFFVLHFFLASGLQGWRAAAGAARRRIVRHYLVGMTALLVTSAPWIGAMSYKYGHFAISTAGHYNWSMRHPSSLGELVPGLGFLPPAHPGDVSAWDDPASLPAFPWSPWDSPAHARHFLNVVAHNTWRALVIMPLRASLLALPILLLSLLALRRYGRRWPEAGPQWLLPLLTILLLPSGYVLLDVTEQYLWFSNLLTLGLGAQWLSAWTPRRAAARPLALAVLLGSFVAFPGYQLVRYWNSTAEIPALAREIAARYHLSGSLASQNAYRPSLLLAFFLRLPYYNVPSRVWDETETGRRLDRLAVNYYLVWNESPPRPLPKFLEQRRELTTNASLPVRIFELRPPHD